MKKENCLQDSPCLLLVLHNFLIAFYKYFFYNTDFIAMLFPCDINCLNFFAILSNEVIGFLLSNGIRNRIWVCQYRECFKSLTKLLSSKAFWFLFNSLDWEVPT